MTEQAIYSDRCWLDGRLQPATVFIQDQLITRVEPGRCEVAEDIPFLDAGNSVLMPGVIDVHVHVNEPGRTEWEGFATATRAALAGGITTIVDMPLNASPVTTTLAAFEEKLAASRDKLFANVGFYAGLVPGNGGEIESLINAGVLGVKAFLTHSGIDEFPNVTAADLEAVAPLLARRNVPLLAHCELDEAGTKAALELDPRSYAAYLASRPKVWENRAVEMVIDLCRRHRCPVHIVHVSSAEALPLIAAAKAEGLPLTAETCPHYLLFDAESIPDGQTIYKCAPPIRERANNEKLKAALGDGTLDLVASDHSPAPPDIKELQTGNLLKAWGGIAGLQFLLPASWTALRNVLTLEEFIPLLTEAPANFLRAGHRKGYLRAGYDGDLVIWNPEEQFVTSVAGLKHRHKISPYLDRQLYGKVQHTIIGAGYDSTDTQQPKQPKATWLFRK
ncbi:allantoinase AllB [Flaviaesturariibacter flavus]|uniref:allantoinase n=1 Tax=Flaviaesturariibacter flavus TaxID=2502780 RepID=A0A4R1BPQ8_9BACT|nr:allantoinase AllB [Flaviaesturariibacter flavus]TCJ19620.1 allantoinase AllB [Flaviaesturariibacter flavus]